MPEIRRGPIRIGTLFLFLVCTIPKVAAVPTFGANAGSTAHWEQSPPPDCDGHVKVILNMIVKDEAQRILPLLHSVRGIVTDYVIVDTGSTDGTPQVLEERGINVYYEPFKDFATTRNHALALGRRVAGDCPAYLLLMDADYTLQVEDDKAFRSLLASYEMDVVQMYQKRDFSTYLNTRLVKADLPDSAWVGAVHEVLVAPEGAIKLTLPIEVAWIEDRNVGNARDTRAKFEWYRQLLEEDLEQDPHNGRAVFYLANTYRDLDMDQEAINMYERKVNMTNQWIEEMVESRYQLVKLYKTRDIAKAVEHTEAIRSSGRLRPEPFYEMTRYYREAGDRVEAVKYLLLAEEGLRAARRSVPLFYLPDIGDIWLPYEEFIMWWYMHPDHLDLARDIAKRLLTNNRVPLWMKESVRWNWDTYFCVGCGNSGLDVAQQE